MDELTAIELLRSLLLEEKTTLPPNSMQMQKARQAAMPPAPIAVAAPNPTAPLKIPYLIWTWPTYQTMRKSTPYHRAQEHGAAGESSYNATNLSATSSTASSS